MTSAVHVGGGNHEPAAEDVRIRSKYSGGKIVKSKYPITQPNCHSTYRHYFNTTDDILNKLSVGPNTVAGGEYLADKGGTQESLPLHPCIV